MKVLATGDGLVLQLSQMEQATVVKQSSSTDMTPRQVLEHYASIMTANFEQDIHDAIDDAEELTDDKN